MYLNLIYIPSMFEYTSTLVVNTGMVERTVTLVDLNLLNAVLLPEEVDHE